MRVHRDVIQAWLTTHLAEQLGMTPQDIDMRKPFTEYGLDSIVGMSLAGDLEDWLELKLSPTLLWDYPTTETLSWYLAERAMDSSSKQAAPWQEHQVDHHSASIDWENAAQLLAQLDELSDTDVDILLDELLTTEDVQV